MHTRFSIGHSSALDDDGARALPAGDRIASVAKFTGLALAFAAGICAVQAISSLPPGRAALHVAPGQTAAAIGLEALGSRTDFFNVDGRGLSLEVSAPEGESFEFAGGGRGSLALVRVPVNGRESVEFDMVSQQGGRHRRTVDFRGWSAPRALSFEGAQEEEPTEPGQVWRTHRKPLGKLERRVPDAASYRYALRPGQRSAVLRLPFAPLSERAATDDCDSGCSGSYVQGADYRVESGHAFLAALTPPPGMLVKGEPGGASSKEFLFTVRPGERFSWTVELVDAGGTSYPLRVTVEASEGPPATMPMRTAPGLGM